MKPGIISKNDNFGSSVPSFTDQIKQLQKFFLAAPLGCNECTCVIVYGQSFSNFVSFLAEETKMSASLVSCASDFLCKFSDLAPVLLVFT
jgi:hypothetical protein